MNLYVIGAVALVIAGLGMYAWGERAQAEAATAKMQQAQADVARLNADLNTLKADKDKGDMLLADKVVEDQQRAAALRARERKLAEVKDACADTVLPAGFVGLLAPVPSPPAGSDPGHPPASSPGAVPHP